MSGSYPSSGWEPYGSSQQQQAVGWRASATTPYSEIQGPSQVDIKPGSNPLIPSWMSPCTQSTANQWKPPLQTGLPRKPSMPTGAPPLHRNAVHSGSVAEFLQQAQREQRELARFETLREEMTAMKNDMIKIRNEIKDRHSEDDAGSSALSEDIAQLHATLTAAMKDIKSKSTQARYVRGGAQPSLSTAEAAIKDPAQTFDDLLGKTEDLTSIVQSMNKRVETIEMDMNGMDQRMNRIGNGVSGLMENMATTMDSVATIAETVRGLDLRVEQKVIAAFSHNDWPQRQHPPSPPPQAGSTLGERNHVGKRLRESGKRRQASDVVESMNVFESGPDSHMLNTRPAEDIETLGQQSARKRERLSPGSVSWSSDMFFEAREDETESCPIATPNACKSETLKEVVGYTDGFESDGDVISKADTRWSPSSRTKRNMNFNAPRHNKRLRSMSTGDHDDHK